MILTRDESTATESFSITEKFSSRNSEKKNKKKASYSTMTRPGL